MARGYTIQLIATAQNEWHPFIGQYVKAYHPGPKTLPLGECVLEVTEDRAKAHVYLTAIHAYNEWRRRDPRVHSERPDGQPSRPLTAFTVSIEPIE
jgi:hypothetical protein